MRELLRKFVTYLTPREEKVLTRLFGIYDGNEVSLEEVARELDTTISMVRVIKEQALAKLRRLSGALGGTLQEDDISDLLPRGRGTVFEEMILKIAATPEETNANGEENMRSLSVEAEIEVLVSFLRERYGSSLIEGTPLVIRDTFSTTDLHEADSYENFADSLLGQASKSLPADLIRDFCDKNRTPLAVWPELRLHLHVILLSDAERDSFFPTQLRSRMDGWDEFYYKYPKSPGIITISRVGLNRRGDMAMVYIGAQYDGLAGSGQIYVFRKRDGTWEKQQASIGGAWQS